MRKKTHMVTSRPKWYRQLFRYPEVWVLAGCALFTRLWQLGTPPAIVFDEVYFRSFASHYLDGHFYFDIHPPLIKLLFAGVGSLFHLSAAEVASGDSATIILRILPALAGAALIPLIYVILRQLRFGRRIATLGALLILFDNALLVESRFVLMDSMLLLSGFGSISAYLALRRSKTHRWLWVVVTGMLLGALVTTKWTGLAIAGLLAVAWFIDGVKNRLNWRRLVCEALVVVGTISVVYIGSFMVNFAMLKHSGDGDAFMSQKFQSTLIGSPYYDPSIKMTFWEKFFELNEEMYSAQSSLNDTTHPYASKWYGWPFMSKPVYYWQGESKSISDGSTIQGHIYLLGNTVIWLLGVVSVVAGFLIIIFKSRWLHGRQGLLAFLLAAYGLNFIPFAFIDRPMFLYHYLFAFIISILIACVLLDRFFEWQAKKYGRHVMTQTYWALIIVVCIGFLYFAPISYGWPLSAESLEQRMWLPTWR